MHIPCNLRERQRELVEKKVEKWGWKELEGCVRVSFSHPKTEVVCRVWNVEFTRKSGNAVKKFKWGQEKTCRTGE